MDTTREQMITKGPKNKKQIGRAGKGDKIYIEDYAVTYLNQVARSPETKSGFAGLFGTCREVEGIKEYYIYAAIYWECEMNFEGGLPREGVQKIMRQRGEMFPEYYFLGWAFVLGDAKGTLWENCYRSRLETLMGKPELLITLKGGTCEEHFFFYPTEMPKETEGYFIFYEENDAMQNFLIDWHGALHRDKCDEEGDNVAESCRNYYKEKKAEQLRSRLASAMLTAAILVLLFAAGVGVQNLNRYDKIQEVGQTLDAAENSEILSEIVSEENITEEVAAENLDSEGFAEESLEKETEVVENAVENSETEKTEPETDSEANIKQEIASEEEPEQKIESKQDVEQEAASEGDSEQEIVSVEIEQEPVPEETAAVTEYITYEVAKGDTLYGICVRYYGNLSRAGEICRINNIEDMDNILYGQKILLPQ